MPETTRLVFALKDATGAVSFRRHREQKIEKRLAVWTLEGLAVIGSTRIIANDEEEASERAARLIRSLRHLAGPQVAFGQYCPSQRDLENLIAAFSALNRQALAA